MAQNAQARVVLRAYPSWFYIPSALVYGLFFLVPTAFAFYFSLTRWSLFDAVFIGFQNYVDFLTDPQLVTGLRKVIHADIQVAGIQKLEQAGAENLKFLHAFRQVGGERTLLFFEPWHVRVAEERHAIRR